MKVQAKIPETKRIRAVKFRLVNTCLPSQGDFSARNYAGMTDWSLASNCSRGLLFLLCLDLPFTIRCKI